MNERASGLDGRVRLYPDGKFRWVYEVQMLNNPGILFDVYKVLGISMGVVWLFMLLLVCIEEGFALESMWGITSVFLILFLVFMLIGLLAYLIVAWVYGWRYVVLYTMDEKRIIHQQMFRQVNKARVLDALTVMAGVVAGKPGVAGVGLLSATRSSSTTVYAKVRRIVPRRYLNLIKLNQLLSINRIYVCDEDFDFVYDFLRSRTASRREGK